MTFEVLKNTTGRDHVTVVELDMPTCSLSYSNAPCTAALGITGDTECYNTFRTCQDQDNYTKTTKTFRFISQTSQTPQGVNIFPCIVSVSQVPTKINVNSISTRATVKIVMSDFPHHDRGVDPYVNNRNFDPSTKGTFWGKFKARHFFFTGRTIRLKQGFVNPDGFDTNFDSDFETREYVIESVDGVDSMGRLTITAKDLLTLANPEKAKAPVASTGKLSGSINDTNTTIQLDSVTGYPSGGGLVRIGDELITYATTSGNNLTGATRGTNNTVARDHDGDDGVQLCLEYTAVDIRDIVEDLLVTYAGIDSSFIDRTVWDAESALDLYDLTTIITEPTGVNQLIGELTQQSNSNLWWDDRQQEIRLKPITTPLSTDVVKVLNDENVIENSVKVIDDRKARRSRITLYFGIRDFTKNLDETSNYLRQSIDIDTQSETDDEYGVPSEMVIFSRWIPTDAVANDLTSRMLIRLKDTPKRINFSVDAKDSELATGDIIYFGGREIQTPTGENDIQLYIITEEKRSKVGDSSRYEAVQFNTGLSGVSPVAFLIADNSQVDFLSASQSEKDTYAFISDNDGKMSDNSDGYKIA